MSRREAKKAASQAGNETYSRIINRIIEILAELAAHSPYAYYFPQGKGMALTSRDADPILSIMRRAVKELAAQAGIIKNINNYTARHTGAEILYTRTNDLRATSNHLGSTMKITEKHYTDAANLAQAYKASELAFTN